MFTCMSNLAYWFHCGESNQVVYNKVIYYLEEVGTLHGMRTRNMACFRYEKKNNRWRF